MFNMMLLTLFVFHVYWGKLIFFMIKKQLNNRGQVGDDVRSGKTFLRRAHLSGCFTFSTSWLSFASGDTLSKEGISMSSGY
jgi:hypothetical protein